MEQKEVLADIRPENPKDLESIRRVNEVAFGGQAEANIVDRLRRDRVITVSLVATVESETVGNIVFSPVQVGDGSDTFESLGLGPMAVLPDFQRKGIGSRLVETGLDFCRTAGYGTVFVLGHPEFYPRFGFVPTRPIGIESEYDVPPEAFMVVELHEGKLNKLSGTVKYHQAFSEAETP